jgi:hypothetical protein
MALDIKWRLSVRPTYTTTGVGNDAVYRPLFDMMYSLADGTGANQADRMLVRAPEIVSSGSPATANVDLSSTTESILGTQGSMAEVVGVMLVNKDPADAAGTSSNTLSYRIGTGSNRWEGVYGSADVRGQYIEPGGFFAFINPDATGLGAVTAGTGDLVPINSSSGTATERVVFVAVGRSA